MCTLSPRLGSKYLLTSAVVEFCLRTVTSDSFFKSLILQRNFTKLHLACVNGDYEAAQRLLEEVANPNSEGPYGLTPFHIVIRFNKTQTFRLHLTT